MDPITVSEKLLFSTIRIETVSGAGKGTGTGFVFLYEFKGVGDKGVAFIVTNKHVIDGADTGVLNFTMGQGGKPIMGAPVTLTINDFSDLWHGHPSDSVDITVTPLQPLIQELRKVGLEVFFRGIKSDVLPSKKVLSELDVIETVTFIGYPNGLWDSKNFLPITRRGVTATPVFVDFEGEKKFLIDASVFPGSSGSPVLIINTGMYTDKLGHTKLGSRVLFLGVVAEVFYKEEMGEIKMVSQPTVNIPVSVTKQMIDLGVVFKGETVVEAIEDFLDKKGIQYR